MESICEVFMSEPDNLLAIYQTLVREHTIRFEPELGQLRLLVEQRMQEIRQQEQPLIAAQLSELNRITQALSSDARCLISTSEFHAFVQQLLSAPANRWYRSSPTLTVSDNPNTWLLRQLEYPLQLSEYRIIEENDAYDDENYYTSYQYSLLVRLGSVGKTIEVRTGRLSYGNPTRYEAYEPQYQQEEIADELEGAIEALNLEASQMTTLLEEVSCLVCYARSLFGLEPSVANFNYSA